MERGEDQSSVLQPKDQNEGLVQVGFLQQVVTGLVQAGSNVSKKQATVLAAFSQPSTIAAGDKISRKP